RGRHHALPQASERAHADQSARSQAPRCALAVGAARRRPPALACRDLRTWKRPRGAAFKNGGEGGIRTPVPVTRQDAFEAPPLRPLRYLSVFYFARWGPFHIPHLPPSLTCACELRRAGCCAPFLPPKAGPPTRRSRDGRRPLSL